MIKIEFNDSKFDIPENWSEIKLCDYEKWFHAQPDTKADYVRFVAEVCRIDHSLLLHSPTSLFDIIVNGVGFVFDNDFTPSNFMTIDHEKYFVSVGDKLTLGEWVDVESVLSSNSEAKLSEMLAILCRPIGEEYSIDMTQQRQELFRNQTCDKVLPLIAFFLRRKNESDEILRLYSNLLEEANQFRADIERFVENGGGIKRLPIWQRIKYTFLMKSLKKELSKFSDFYSIAPIR